MHRGGGAAEKVGLELSQRDSCEWHPGPSLAWVHKTFRLQSSLAPMDPDRTSLGWCRGEWRPFTGRVTFQPLACVQLVGRGGGRERGRGKEQEGWEGESTGEGGGASKIKGVPKDAAEEQGEAWSRSNQRRKRVRKRHQTRPQGRRMGRTARASGPGCHISRTRGQSGVGQEACSRLGREAGSHV